MAGLLGDQTATITQVPLDPGAQSILNNQVALGSQSTAQFGANQNAGINAAAGSFVPGQQDEATQTAGLGNNQAMVEGLRNAPTPP